MKRKKTPRYRLINRYSKSSRQYGKERARRKKTFELLGEGFTLQQIAEMLGVCEKTVSRDLKRTRRFHTGQVNRMIRLIEAERDAEYTKRYESLSPYTETTLPAIYNNLAMAARDLSKANW
ncbi:MAG: hypothetical protein OEY30_01465 [Candidatus Bathyarchaeota archaeon]|nr:hypothetical protein [Candidatus Bathyarchaeota archaeon]